MKAKDSTISFKPLAGGRFRVIIREDDGKTKSGPRIKSGQTKRARSAGESQRLHRLHPQQPSVREPVSSGRRTSTSKPGLRQVSKDSNGGVFCPFCYYYHSPRYFSISAGERACSSCGERFVVVSAESVPSLPRAEIDFVGDVKCPHCNMWNFGVSPGEHTCPECYKKFMVVR